MKSEFYYGSTSDAVSNELKDLINTKMSFLTPETIGSPRAVGDALEKIVADNLQKLLGDWCKDYSNDFARRAMADLAFTDKDGFHSIVDVKTHRHDTKFNMPNLTSVDRLSRLYESDTDVFSILMIEYKVLGDKALEVTECFFVPIEFLNWSCLTIGALGWGQIQIANSNEIDIAKGTSRKTWMLEFCEKMESFYPKEINKIIGRLDRFAEVKKFWKDKKDTWV